MSRRKHHGGRLGDQTDLYLSRMPFLDEPVDLVVECVSSDSQFERVAEYEAELEASLTFRDGQRVVRISHHLAQGAGPS